MFPLLLLLACAEPDVEAPASGGPPPARVEVALARDGVLDEAWTTFGEVVPLAQSELAAGASGPVSQVPHREGDAVEEGALLMQVDAAPAAARVQAAEAALAQAQAQHAQAKLDLGRLAGVDTRVLAASELDAARTRVATLAAGELAAQAALTEARVQHRRHRVTAPFAGVVTGRHVDPGDWVQPGTPVVDLVSARAIEVQVDAAWELARRLDVGTTATALSSGRASTSPLTVVAVVPTLDPTTRTSRVRLAPSQDPPPQWLRPGAPVEVRFEVTVDGAGVVVPRDALVLAPGSAKVVKVSDGKAAHVVVIVVATGDTEALVRSTATGPDGLSAGDTVVIRGNERVRPGQPLLLPEGG